MELISKSEFKVHALEVFRDIEKTGESRIITDRGKPYAIVKGILWMFSGAQ